MFQRTRSALIGAIAILLPLASAQAAPEGFLRAQDRFLGTDTGIVQLRGLGLGGWMLQEGYMVGTADFAGTQHEIRARLESVVGATRAEAFYQAWRDNFLTRRDVDSLAAWGFNSLRLPMHWNLYMEAGLPVRWKDEGFRRTDSLLAWCKANRIWLILDLHAAPGGQGNDRNISDGDPAQPSLWQNADNRSMAVALWKKLAERYRGERWIGAYDLLNEPNWPFEGTHPNGCDEANNTPLWDLYRDMTSAIRSVDPDHLIILEGNCWGGSYGGLPTLWDSNLALSFHKYWNATDAASLNGMFALRDSRHVPIWLGESGENGNEWFRQTIRMAETEKIGWSWWPYKKIESVVGPVSVASTAGWDAFVAWGKGGSRPDSAALDRGLVELADNLRLPASRINRDVLDAMFRQVRTDATRPWRDIHVPGSFGAEEFDLGGDGFAYHDARSMNVGVKDEGTWNNGWSFRNDGVDLQWSSEEKTWNVGWIEPGEWLDYTVVADTSASWVLVARTAGFDGGEFAIALDGLDAATLRPTSTAGWSTWTDSRSGAFPMAAGAHTLRLRSTIAGCNLGRLALAPATRECLQDGKCQTVDVRRPRSGTTGSVEWDSEGIRSSWTEPVEVRVTDLRGRVLVHRTLRAGDRIAPAELPRSGLFLLQAEGQTLRVARP